MSTLSPARRLAHKVLVRVERDGAFADRALDAEFGKTGLASDDRALATQLVYGTLRHQLTIDFWLRNYVKHKPHKLPPEVRSSLRMGAFQLAHSRAADHAVVNDAVTLVGKRNQRLRGVVNGVLRNLGRAIKDDALPRPNTGDAIEDLAINSAHPAWLLRDVASQRGAEATQAFAEANNCVPPVTLRVNSTRTTTEELLKLLHEHEPRLVDGFIQLRRAGQVTSLPGFADGLFSVQDAAAQRTADLSPVSLGDRVLDTCAAPGGKTTHLAERVGPDGHVLALDIHPQKTRLIAANAERLGLDNITTAAGDATDPGVLKKRLADLGWTDVDHVMVDAPCSGMGTLRRTPELRNRAADTVATLVRIQDAILDSVAPMVRPGGSITYAVCSVTKAEGPERAAAFLQRHPDFATTTASGLWVTDMGPVGPVLQTWPDLHDADGFFAVVLSRRA